MKLKGNPYSDQRKEKEQWRDRMIDFNFGDSSVDDLQDSLSQKFAEVSNVELTELVRRLWRWILIQMLLRRCMVME